MAFQAWATIPASVPTLLMPANAIPFAASASPASPILLRPNPFSCEALSIGPIANLTPAFMRSVETALPGCSVLRGLLSDGASSLPGSSTPSGSVLSSGENDAAIVANNILVLYQESVNSTVAVIGQNSFYVTPSDVDDIARLTREIE
ncbi:hypothetical protein PRIPAC_93295, partial [Pristionchus pacificus]|uniref:Uncharacterized protein n=1 Tax=Pristionchus pacificus TaxID=54126 RepID=A0A2A6CHG9_PRIPA